MTTENELTEELSAGNAARAAVPILRSALQAMVAAYREGCADEDEPSMVVHAIAALRLTSKIEAEGPSK